MKKNRQFLHLLVIIAVVVIAVTLLVRHFHIKNFFVVREDVLYTSGQPRRMDYTRLLYRYHIGTIVNVRTAAEHRERNWYNEEITWVRNNGVKYFELPVDRSVNRADYFPDEATQRQFLDIIRDKNNLPVLLHGSSGRKRVSMLAAVWLIKAEGFSTKEVIEVVERIKASTVTKAEREFIEGLRISAELSLPGAK
jgi:protein tyrosine/serine phosphatase